MRQILRTRLRKTLKFRIWNIIISFTEKKKVKFGDEHCNNFKFQNSVLVWLEFHFEQNYN